MWEPRAVSARATDNSTIVKERSGALRNIRTVRVMEGIKLLFVVVFTLGVERTYAQTSNYRLLTGSEARDVELGQDPELLQFTARPGDRVFINITGVDDRLAILQENVNALLDCLPFLSMFPGGRITWLWLRLDEFGNPAGDPQIDVTGGASLIEVGGEFNHSLNITQTRIGAFGADPNAGIYTCRVCVGQGALQMCRGANTTVHLLGSPPDLDCGEPNDGTACVLVVVCVRACVCVCHI